MASRRLPLNLYLLKTGASPSSAIPAARVASIAEGAEADGTDELSPNQDVSDSGSWLRTWLLTDG